MITTRFFHVNQPFLRSKRLPRNLNLLLYLLFEDEKDAEKIEKHVQQFILEQKQQGGFPIIQEDQITFCYYGKINPPISVLSSFNGWKNELLTLTQVGSTEFYYASTKLPLVSDIIYKFLYFNDEFQQILLTDPLNRLITFEPMGPEPFPHSSLVRLNESYRSTIELAHPAYPSPFDHIQARPIYVYLPPNYYRDTGKRYPVLYLQDGQYVFDDYPYSSVRGWEVNHAADYLISQKRIQEIIIVAVPHALGDKRMAEYSPVLSSQNHGLLGYGPAYVDYLVNSIKPYIDQEYRTIPDSRHTSIAGSSLGALISFWASFTYPDVFSNVGCLSPSFWFEGFQGESVHEIIQRKGKFDLKIYMDTGTGGISQDVLPYARQVRVDLIHQGWVEGKDLFYIEEEGALHNELAWRNRFPYFLEFLYGI